MKEDAPMASPAKRPKLDDDEVEILSPSLFRGGSLPSSGGTATNANANINGSKSSSGNNNNSNSNGMSQDDDIEIMASTTINPNIDYPHVRFHCGVCSFQSGGTAVANNDGESNSDVNDTNNINGNEKHCNKCYCYICDCPAAECGYWTHDKILLLDKTTTNDDSNDASSAKQHVNVQKLTEWGPHCHAYSDKGKWDALKEVVRGENTAKKDTSTDVTVSPMVEAMHANPHAIPSINNPYNGTHSAAIRNEILHRLTTESNNNHGSGMGMMMERIRAKKDMRITEVFLENFRNAVSLANGNTHHVNNSNADSKNNNNQDNNNNNNNTPKTIGDIPSLSPSTPYIEGIQIGFPFAKIMKPQRLIMIHLIRALKSSKHVVLESPTGTGKSVAILCGCLGWMRWHVRREREEMNSKNGGGEERMESSGGGGRVKIIYCSRTHSQVAQMVTALKSTPYRPRMAILGSRERLCIHKSIKPRTPNAEQPTGININNECRLRVRNTEKYRKHRLTNPSSDDPYMDEDPPDELPGDGSNDAMQEEGEEDNGFMARSRTCPHYRQLTAERIANLAHSTFVPNRKVNCCSMGGKKSKFGSHDIEDLVEFGKDPYVQKGVALYRGAGESFGLSLNSPANGGGCFVRDTKKGLSADISGSLNQGDKILRVNGCNVSKEDAKGVAEKIKQTQSDTLLLDVSRGGSGSLSEGDGGYSSHSACPYYISQVLAKDADLVFCPYNYVLDPQIRRAMGIELSNSVVILDEGHNIESTLRDAGSGRFGEFELYDLIVMLSNYSITEKTSFNMLEVEGEGDTMYLCDVAHALLLFVEKVALKLKESRQYFEQNPGSKGAQAALRDYEKFHSADDTEFEISLHGPTGRGVRGAAVGCLPFFEQLGILQSDLEMLERYVDAFEKFCRGQESNESSGERDRISNLTDRLLDLVHKMCSARSNSEHYYSAIVACANGNLDFANGVDAEGGRDGARRWKKKPRTLPLIPPRTVGNPDRAPNPCLHAFCKARSPNILNPIRHGHSCDGSTPKWEAVLTLELLTPGPLFQELANECRTVVLASGSLAPIPSLCAELNLFSSETQIAEPKNTSSTSKPAVQKRLQIQPPPLEADHVVNLDKQLFVTSIGQFSDGSEVHVSHRNYSKKEFLQKLGDSIVKVVEGIPYGGVLVFLPNYALLRKCERLWNPSGDFWGHFEESHGPSVWERLRVLKHKVIMEPSGGNQVEFEEKKQEYMDSVDQRGGCILFAVYRGKMSEGISFNDNYARGVICIGVPLPSTFALPVKIKMQYNDEQRELRKRTDLLPGREWYSQQAYRAIAQALGRCIRHSADYGAIILMDSRHCDNNMPNDGTPDAHKKLPKWMRKTVRNLRMDSTPRNMMYSYGSSSNTVCGGYVGLKNELGKFFRDAKPYAASIAQSQTATQAGASRPGFQTPQTTPPPGSSKNPLTLSTGAGSSVIKSVQHIQLSTASKSSNSNSHDVMKVDPLPSSTGIKIVSKQNTLMNAFQKQKDMEPSAKTAKASKPTTTPANIKSMFQQQHLKIIQTKEQNLHPNLNSIELDTEPNSTPAGQITCTQDLSATTTEMQSALNPPAHTFKRSPFSEFTEYAFSSPQDPSSSSTDEQRQTTLASSSTLLQDTANESCEVDENLCVICEDGKKQVVLLPCKHMCLCKACADFEKIKECPMCRSNIESSMAVFI